MTLLTIFLLACITFCTRYLFLVSLAKDLQPTKISVGIYHPGYVQTDMVNNAGQTSNGDISAHVAAERLIGLMDGLTLADSGVFKHSNGEVLPW